MIPDNPTPRELIDEARKVTPTTFIRSTPWRPSDFVHLMADALERALIVIETAEVAVRSAINDTHPQIMTDRFVDAVNAFDAARKTFDGQ